MQRSGREMRDGAGRSRAIICVDYTMPGDS